MDKNLLILAVSSFKALSIVFLTIALVLPVGFGLLRLFKIQHAQYSKLSISFALGFIFQALLVFCIHYLGIQSLAYEFSYLALFPLIFLVLFRVTLSLVEKRLLVFISVASILYAHFIVFPGAQNVTAESARALNGYYSDNLISFNTARIFTEGLSVKETIVVPVWTFFDRTPVAGALVSYLWFFLGIKEKASWLSSSGNNFFYYQAQMIFLNVLSLLAIGCFLMQRTKKVLPTLLVLLSAPFVFLNLGFAWPKYLSTFFIIVGLDLISFVSLKQLVRYRELFLAGIFIGLGYLTHDSAILYIATLFVILFLLSLFTDLVKFKQFVVLTLGLFLVLSPWFIFRAISEVKSSHMFALHFFCITDFSYQDLNFNEAFKAYILKNSFFEIFKIKLGNLIYPFSILDFFKSLKSHFFDISEWLKIAAILSKYQLIHALTLPVFLISLFGISQLKSKGDICWWLVLSGLVSILPASVLFGCEKSTWNHIWAFTPTILLALPLEYVFRRYRALFFISIVCCLLVTSKLLIVQADFFNHASFAYLFWAGLLSLILLNLSYTEKCYSD